MEGFWNYRTILSSLNQDAESDRIVADNHTKIWLYLMLYDMLVGFNFYILNIPV
jgi:hypothetical protein